ncbi:MotA/TolQ/ExbB proton channel family protein [Sansalvadorimonas verongulae]|nr:MotA/TolQ/ExbB proton channel family protein [Sansalvadorimonas verongulae]
MLPIVLCSMLAMAIVIERFWALRREKVAPKNLLPQVWKWFKDGDLNNDKLKELRRNSPLGEIMAAGLANARHGREIMKESIDEAASKVVHELERYLNALGTVAAIAPLLGLLGTVIGMIDVFTVIMLEGSGNAAILAGGISKALVTTAAGLSVAIPAVIFHRFLVRRVDELVVTLEQDATRLVEVVQGERQVDFKEMGNGTTKSAGKNTSNKGVKA